METTMNTLEEFFRTGRLGPITLGIGPQEVMNVLGDPDDVSRKSNPLQLRYGCVLLLFWKSSSHTALQLTEILISYQQEFRPFPDALALADWDIKRAPSKQDLESYLVKIHLEPAMIIDGLHSKRLLFPSGVTVLLDDRQLLEIRLGLKQTKSSQLAHQNDKREPSTDDLRGMLEEARLACRMGAKRAGFLIAWAALESVLRQIASKVGGTGKIGVAPSMLIRELVAQRIIDRNDYRDLEELRQVRTLIAHGVNNTSERDIELPTILEKVEKYLNQLRQLSAQ